MDVQANFIKFLLYLHVFVIILCDSNQLILEHCFQEKHCDMVVVVSAPAEQQPGVSDVDDWFIQRSFAPWKFKMDTVPKITGLVKGISFQNTGYFDLVCVSMLHFRGGTRISL